jgi:archaellum component FlaD/FlaE
VQYGKCSFRGPGRKQRNKTSKEGKTNSNARKHKSQEEGRSRRIKKQKSKEANKHKKEKQTTRKQKREDAIQDKSEQKLHNAILKWKYSKQIPSQIKTKVSNDPKPSILTSNKIQHYEARPIGST